MNIALEKTGSSQAKVVLSHTFKYKTNKKYGLGQYLKLRSFNCQDIDKPSKFIPFTCNVIFLIQDKNI